jgi:transcriptional regulator with XRE-family HTH domain
VRCLFAPEATTLAERLEAERRGLGVTLDQVAGYLGWDPATLTRYLNGKWQIPANRQEALELLLSSKSSDLTNIQHLPRRRRGSGQAASS